MSKKTIRYPFVVSLQINKEETRKKIDIIDPIKDRKTSSSTQINGVSVNRPSKTIY